MGLVFLIFAGVLMLLGIAFVAIANVAGKSQSQLNERCTIAVEAELVDTMERSEEWSERIEISYHGVYAYATQEDVRVQAENAYGYGLPDEVPGPRVTIRYNPDKPTEFILPDEYARVEEANILPGLRRSGIGMLIAAVPLAILAVVFWR